VAWIAQCRAGQLDRELAAGKSAQASQVIARRADRITRRRSRGRLADGLASVRRSADDPRPGLSAAVRPDVAGVLGARTVIEAVERRLRAPEPVRARGVAMLQLLLTENASPLYRPAGPGALAGSLRAAAAELEPPA
jgi:hypothetical protein